MSERAELLLIADTIERNGGWHIAAVKVRAAAERIAALEALLHRTKAALSHYPGAWKSLNDAIDVALSGARTATDTEVK